MNLDTNAISALFVGDSSLARVLSGVARHHLPVIAIGEYRFGLQRSRHRHHLESLLDELERNSQVLAITGDTARFYAAVREQLRQRGRPIPENDVWIAALAFEHRQPLVSQDRHFDAVPGLKRISWLGAPL